MRARPDTGQESDGVRCSPGAPYLFLEKKEPGIPRMQLIFRFRRRNDKPIFGHHDTVRRACLGLTDTGMASI